MTKTDTTQRINNEAGKVVSMVAVNCRPNGAVAQLLSSSNVIAASAVTVMFIVIAVFANA